MPTAEDIMCKIIPLYKVEIEYEDKDEYADIIVADTLEGVIHGLVDVEMIREDYHGGGIEKCSKKFDIVDFLYVPCAGSKRGFHLFDIEDVDCAEWYGAMIDGPIYYRCYFAGDKHFGPPETLEKEAGEKAFAEPRAVADVAHQPRETSDLEAVFESYKERDAVMDVLYDMSKSHPYRKERIAERDQKRSSLHEKAEARVKDVMSKEKA